jgi:hypothetical protein
MLLDVIVNQAELISVNQLIRALRKSRKIRRLLKKHISKNVPRSSRIHHFIRYTFTVGSKRIYGDGDRRCVCKARIK